MKVINIEDYKMKKTRPFGEDVYLVFQVWGVCSHCGVKFLVDEDSGLCLGGCFEKELERLREQYGSLGEKDLRGNGGCLGKS